MTPSTEGPRGAGGDDHIAGAGKMIADAARVLTAKLRQVHADPQYESVWTVNQIHVGPYTGPTYADELAALEAALGAKS